MRTTEQKICVVGFQKTGTTTLKTALVRLGYSVGCAAPEINRILDPNSPDADATVRKTALQVLREHDAIQDSPAAFLYREFDQEFPGSKFILTHRPTDKWVASVGRYFGNKCTPLRQWMYGVEQFSGNEQRFAEIYDAQNKAIRDYFRDRPGDFVEMDLAKGDGWHKLVNFLGPEFLPPFPKENVGGTYGDHKKARRQSKLAQIFRAT